MDEFDILLIFALQTPQDMLTIVLGVDELYLESQKGSKFHISSIEFNGMNDMIFIDELSKVICTVTDKKDSFDMA